QRRRAGEVVGYIGDGQGRAGYRGRQRAAGEGLSGGGDQRGKTEGEEPRDAGKARNGDHATPPLVVVGVGSKPPRITAAPMLTKVKVDGNRAAEALSLHAAKFTKLPSFAVEPRRKTGFSTGYATNLLTTPPRNHTLAAS